jgi:hypothetical protein
MGIKHAGHTIETETIELILIHPETKIAQKESQHFVVTIVEQPAIPKLVAAPYTLMEVKVVAAVELVQAVKHVLRCMTMNNVQQNCDAQSMRSVDELFQVVRETVTAACSKEAVDLVPEACVVCVLHDRHELNNIVAQMLDSGEDVMGELFVCRNLGFGR